MILHFALLAFLLPAAPAFASNLAEIFQQALAEDPVLSSAEYERYALQGDKEKVCGRLWPQVRVPASYTVFDQDKAGTSLGQDTASTSAEVSGKQAAVGLAVSQTLFDMPAFTECRKARIVQNRGDITYERELENLVHRVVQAYIAVLAAKSADNTARAKLDLYEAQFREATKGFDVAKTVSKLELALAVERWKNAAADKAAAEGAVQLALDRLMEITGVPADPAQLAHLKGEAAIPLPEPMDFSHWTALAETQNLKLLESEMSVRIAEYDMKAAYGEMWPSVDLFARHNIFDNDINRAGAPLPSDSDRFSNESVGVSMSVPLYAGGSNRGAARASENRFKSAQRKHDALVRGVHTDVKRNMEMLRAGVAAVEAARSSLEAARANLSAVEGGVRAETKTKTDLLDAESRLLEAENRLASTRYDYIMGMVGFWRSVGALSAASVAEIDGLLAREESTN